MLNTSSREPRWVHGFSLCSSCTEGRMGFCLVSCFCGKPGMELHQRGQSMDLRQCHTNQGNVQLWHSECSNTKIMMSQGRLVDKRGHDAFIQGFSVCETYDGTKISLGLSYTTSTEAACHHRYDFRPKRCASNGGANLNGVGRRAGRTGLNLHLIPVILFATNKLKPEKT